jgi:hypothetical protein
MASLSAIRTAVKTTLQDAIPGLHAYDTIPDVPNVLPCAVVMPSTADFLVAMGRGADTWMFDLLVLVGTGDVDAAQYQLDGFVSGAGAGSIREAIWQNRGLGLEDGTDAHVAAMTGYNLQFSAATMEHLGATLRLVVHTAGAA